ncbi:tRNA (N6-threonylcarbamoyladenosine(37)-N6)-methyltransferase TrmO [Acinetobacter brisouii]|uniref:tRNA (N6-threonylcarbamoyladenosine(37)-N6)-methyltransferase TrmO n=1 Tax=Acinetobacter brisouii TaxID=396323 RepID=UPI00148EF4E1|nr:tRNA (N6-threonylcarbamoyladenosine(37)-N6)-methyltransferase TrmO [Acinetobacter brisouii]
MIAPLQVPVIGFMQSPFKEKFGIPRQPNLVDVESYIVMQAPYDDPLAFVGIEEFSHLWLLWQFHHNKPLDGFRPQIRPPRLGGNQKIGVFASRSMYRPAPIGLSVVRFKRIEQVDGQLRVYVSGADLLDGTPIVDIKPYIAYSDAIADAQSGYAREAPVLNQVVWSEIALSQRIQLTENGLGSSQLYQEIEQVLALDPRPAYQDDPERVYGLHFADLNVRFQVKATEIVIVELIAYGSR